ncbi:ATP-grasp domain-containing protein [Streptomyces pacificus]|uniref:ATP-grasp domain-containing protein n=1 Tax=Streptomyces pacificus TaxID=2705029 RepID=A0A6A0AS37_9ACTN|nr:ATP-grasp domain-containing protein [Streptomyces pacificus]GFH35739.1 ATP-grasp domain-containing protein [Streptomyces pacificus]
MTEHAAPAKTEHAAPAEGEHAAKTEHAAPANNRLLMVQPYTQFVEKAVALGFEVWSIWDPTLQPASYLAGVEKASREMLWVDFSDEAALRRLVRRTALAHDVGCLLHLGEEATMVAVAEEAQALGLALNPPEALRRLNDKAALRELLAGHGLSPVRTAVAGTPDEVASLLAGFGLPAVVKPTRLQGSAAVRLVRGPADLDAWRRELAGHGYRGPVLVEEYLRGPEFSVETLTRGGRHLVVGITAKRKTPAPAFVETGHVFPAPLADTDADAIGALVTAVLDAAGYRFGPAHTEVILTGAGPRVVESQARFGGDRIPALIRLATGFDIEGAVFDLLVGGTAEPAPAERTAAISFFAFPPGRITRLEGMAELDALPHVHGVRFPFAEGDVLPPTRHSGSRHGHVIVTGGTAEEAERLAAETKALPRVETGSAVLNAVTAAPAAPMRPDRTLLLIGHLTEPVRIAKELGLNVILVQHKEKFQPEQAELADVTLIADYTDWSVLEPLARAAHTIWNFSAALSLTEPGLEPAGRVNDLFGLGGTGFEPARLLRDKLAMRRHLAAAGAPTVAAEPLTGRDSLADFGAAHGYPFVVKPVDLTAGYALFRVAGPQDVDGVWERIGEARRTGMDRGSTMYAVTEFLMEQYIDGPEYSVEAFSFHGRHTVVAVTEKLTGGGHFVELGHAQPARLDPADEQRLVEAAGEFLDAIGITDGPSHTELRLSSRGPLIIEGHNRLGGDRIPELVQAAYGVDLTRYAIAWPFGLVEPMAKRPEPVAAGCVRGIVGRPGRVAAITGADELRAHPSVLALDLAARPGSVIRPIQDNWDRLGLLAVTAAGTDEAVVLCEKLLATVLTVSIEDATEEATATETEAATEAATETATEAEDEDR